MRFWIADLFEHGHTLDEIYDMLYSDYEDLVTSLGEKRGYKSQDGNTSGEIRPVQKEAIRRAKELKKK